MMAEILPADSCGLIQVKNSLRVSQNYPGIIGAVNYKNFVVSCDIGFYKSLVKRRGRVTYKNFAGQYVLRQNLTRHCLAAGYAASCPSVKSNRIALYGNTILPWSSWSITPAFSNACTSRCTPRKSRPVRRASSRIDTAPAPVMALMICSRPLMSMVLASVSTSGNVRVNGDSTACPDIAAVNDFFASSKEALTGITRTTSVLITLPPDFVNIFTLSGCHFRQEAKSTERFQFPLKHCKSTERLMAEGKGQKPALVSVMCLSEEDPKAQKSTLEQNQPVSLMPRYPRSFSFLWRCLLRRRKRIFSGRCCFASWSCRSVSRGIVGCSLSICYPFGSMPRCCNSLRMIRFIHAAKDSSPSSCLASSIFSRSSGSKRNWNGGLPRLSFLCVDTSITPCVEYVCVMTHYIHKTQKATPRSVRALPRRLTTNVSKDNEAAMKNDTTHTQRRDLHSLKKEFCESIKKGNTADHRIFTSSGLCFLSQSLSAAFMRVCQPLPVALNASTTSGEHRNVTRTLGFIALGRPGLTSFSPSYKSAPEKNASSSSGASSGSVQVFFKSCAFAFIGFPHGDNTPHVTAWRPDQDYNAPFKFSGCYVARFAVILAYILSGEMFARKHLASPRKIKAALVKRPVAFVIVEVNFHVISVRTKNIFANCLHLLASVLYVYPAPHKTGAGIETPKLLQATPDAASVFFVVRYMRHSMAWCSQLLKLIPLVAKANYHAAHNGAMCCYSAGLAPSTDTLNSASRHPIMVTLAGQPQGWPVPCNAGSLNPVNVTALYEIETSSGDSLNLLQEAA